MPDFTARVRGEEMMDDFTITDDRLTRALENLRWTNRLLGGYAASLAALAPFLQAQAGRPVRVLDLGTGAADFPEHLIRWAARRGLDVRVTAVDANPATVDYARAALDRRLPPALRPRVEVICADAFALPFEDGAFDVAHAALFLHHFPPDQAAALVRTMARVARRSLVVNDLHRHPLAYYGIRLLGALLPVSPMYRHDGPLSVLRAFRRDELVALAEAADLDAFAIRWHWAFRWTLATV